MATEVARKTCSCGRSLILWPYVWVEGDVLFESGYIVAGKGEVREGVAYVCATCDQPHKFPMIGRNK